MLFIVYRKNIFSTSKDYKTTWRKLSIYTFLPFLDRLTILGLITYITITEITSTRNFKNIPNAKHNWWYFSYQTGQQQQQQKHTTKIKRFLLSKFEIQSARDRQRRSYKWLGHWMDSMIRIELNAGKQAFRTLMTPSLATDTIQVLKQIWLSESTMAQRSPVQKNANVMAQINALCIANIDKWLKHTMDFGEKRRKKLYNTIV